MGHHLAALLIGIVTLGGTHVAAGQGLQPDTAELRVLVLNEAHVRPEMLSAVEEYAGSIYASAGVQVTWLHPSWDRAIDGPIDLTVKITRGFEKLKLADLDDHCLGFAAVNPARAGQRGRLAWVFYDQVEKYAGRHQVQVDRLCARVVAHEIGHLFLPAGHSESGLMSATWDLRLDVLDYFTSEQAETIRTRISSRRPSARARDVPDIN
jgi:predicted DNA-binding ribbon-helix-helix protein